jgi:hypothetical protein
MLAESDHPTRTSFRAVAAEIGLRPAIEILQGERARVTTILRN